MFSRCPSLLMIGALALSAGKERVLRVCADPNNLPFSNDRGEGFENRLAEMIAAELSAKLEYTWLSERKWFIRNFLNEGRCDAVMGIPTALDSVTATKPYYRSSYVFVSRRDQHFEITSLDDPRLANWRIGIHVVGDDYAPPASALARRGITSNIVGFSLFGSYGEPNPPAKIMDAVVDGRIHIAIVWGPLAGYFAKGSKISLDVVPVLPAMFLAVPFTYDISIGVRKGNYALRDELNDALERKSAPIQQVLSDYGVPQVP